MMLVVWLSSWVSNKYFPFYAYMSIGQSLFLLPAHIIPFITFRPFKNRREVGGYQSLEVVFRLNCTLYIQSTFTHTINFYAYNELHIIQFRCQAGNWPSYQQIRHRGLFLALRRKLNAKNFDKAA